SSLSRTFKSIVNIARTCKAVFPDVPIALGGYFATFNHDKILAKYDCFEFVVRHEGEETAIELVQALEQTHPSFTNIRGLSYREQGYIRINADRPLQENLDAIPFPAYELIAHYNYGSIGGLHFISSKTLGGLLTSRGCYYRCKYCACSAFTHHTIRWRSPENVVDELKYLYNKFGLREYLIIDDVFTSDKRRVIKLCRLIQEEGLDLKWYCEGRVDHADNSMFREMVRAGCKAMYFGIESGVNRILRYYQKGTTYQMAKDAVKKARSAGFENVVGSFILGAPIETVAEMWETVWKAVALDIDFAQFFPLLILTGTPLWEDLVQQGVIDDERQWEKTMVNGFEIHPEVTMDGFLRLFREFNKAFFLRKSFLLKQIWRSLLYRKKSLLINLRNQKRFRNEFKRVLYL
ncbi:MAG: B12-binding domain-containing radical SAM protein, partial [Candidatus Sifarchaeia archaeon]